MTETTETPAIDVAALQASLVEANASLEAANNRVKRLKNEAAAIDELLIDLGVIQDATAMVPFSNPQIQPRFQRIADGLRLLRERVGHA